MLNRKGACCAAAVGAAAALAAGAHARVTVTRTAYHGWAGAYRISNGTVDLVVVPRIGRIMRYGFVGGPNVLWEDASLAGKSVPPAASRGWANYGGDKLWPAPQARWGWPPDPYLDGGPCRASILRGPALRLTGLVSPRTGLQFVREIRLAPTGSSVTIRNTLRNRGRAPAEWSVWEVAQVDEPDEVLLPVSSDRFAGGYYVFKDSPPAPDLLVVTRKAVRLKRSRSQPAKIGTDSQAGWAASLKGNVTFRVTARVAAGARYPDEGCVAEVFTSPDPLRYCELEVLGPIRKIAPGASTSLVTYWTLQRGTADR